MLKILLKPSLKLCFHTETLSKLIHINIPNVHLDNVLHKQLVHF